MPNSLPPWESDIPGDQNQQSARSNTTGQAPPAAPPPPPQVVRNFSAIDFSSLSENENYRYAKNAKRVAHALIKTKSDGQVEALQYTIPQDGSPTAPVVCQLAQIEQIERYGMVRYRGTSADGKIWYARRLDHAKLSRQEGEEDLDFAYFSEEEDAGKEPFWGSKREVPRFDHQMSEEVRRDFEREGEDISSHVKGGHLMQVDRDSVLFREQNKTRKPDQNTLMGESARDAYENFFGEMEDELSPEMIEILKRAFSANLRKSPENQYRPEWLHAYGFSLTPQGENPQTAKNLGAAGKWANTEMMVLERIAKWFALNKGNSATITLKTLFEMLRDSELINKIHFEVSIGIQDRMIRFIQDLDTFKKYPIFRKASDLAQATAITDALLHHEHPTTTLPVLNAVPGKSFSHRPTLLPPHPPMQTSATPLVTPRVLDANRSHSLKDDEHNEPSLKPFVSGDMTMPKSKYPTYLKHENSIVQVLVTAHEPDYEEPWNGTHIQHCTGTGFVIEHEGEKYVITNAHCVSNQIRTQVRLANNREKKFDAKPLVVAYQADLALLKVKSAKFQEQAQPVVLGDMVGLHDEVFTIGFPMGGDEVSVTKGIVSRIEVQEYAMSGLDMLAVQVDAAINPGNSGGPVFCNDKVAGVAFQGIDHSQALGYMIPIPILNHFLQEVFSGQAYRGFPILPLTLEALENKYQRQFYGMTKEQTGILVSKRSPGTDAHSKLKKDDILLELDGYKISNQGTVDIPTIGNCISLDHLTHMKFIGDDVTLKILRKNDRGIAEVKTIRVNLDRIPLESYVVPQTEYDKMPTYYINSGFVFVPVSRNYLEGPGAHLEEMTIIDEHHGTFTVGNMPKKSPDHQLVAINSVLDCKSTEGYEGFSHELVKTVNGVKINNFADLIQAMENNAEEMHLIETYEGNKIALKKLSEKKLEKIMRTHKISFDRSEDLRVGVPVPEAVLATESASVFSAEEDDAESHVSLGSQDTASDLDEEETSSQTASTASSSEAEEEERVAKPNRAQRCRVMREDEQEAAKAILSQFGSMPGQKRFMASLGAMEQHYRHAPKDTRLVDWDNLSDEEDEDFSPTDKKAKKHRHLTQSAHQGTATFGLFAQTHKPASRKAAEAFEEEQTHHAHKKSKSHHRTESQATESSSVRPS